MISLYGRYSGRNHSLRELFAAKLPIDSTEKLICEPVHQSSRAYLVIRLQQLWGEFCRELIVCSAIGGCTTSTNQRLTRAPGVKRVSDILKVIKLRDLASPSAKWEEAQYTIDQARQLDVANFSTINLGLGGASGVTDNIKCVRNYLVHPNRNNSIRYTNTVNALGFNNLLPDQLLFQTIPGGETVFENWLSTLTLAAWNAVA